MTTPQILCVLQHRNTPTLKVHYANWLCKEVESTQTSREIKDRTQLNGQQHSIVESVLVRNAQHLWLTPN